MAPRVETILSEVQLQRQNPSGQIEKEEDKPQRQLQLESPAVDILKEVASRKPRVTVGAPPETVAVLGTVMTPNMMIETVALITAMLLEMAALEIMVMIETLAMMISGGILNPRGTKALEAKVAEKFILKEVVVMIDGMQEIKATLGLETITTIRVSVTTSATVGLDRC